ncbi:uncharacterized protein LOC144139957 [Haemaphysalis longicornis]
MTTAAVPTDVAWSVAVLAFFVALLSAVVVSNGPVIYVLLMEEFNASHEAASWVSTATCIVTHLGGFIVALLELRFSLYQVTLMAVTVLWVGLLASGFATSTTCMIATLVMYSLARKDKLTSWPVACLAAMKAWMRRGVPDLGPVVKVVMVLPRHTSSHKGLQDAQLCHDGPSRRSICKPVEMASTLGFTEVFKPVQVWMKYKRYGRFG